VPKAVNWFLLGASVAVVWLHAARVLSITALATRLSGFLKFMGSPNILQGSNALP